MKTFTEKVLGVVRRIPKGKVMTYGEVAKGAGSPRAARAVGSILKQNFDPAIPCHRVIPTMPKAMRGKPLSLKNIGQYNRGRSQKLALLRAEGVIK